MSCEVMKQALEALESCERGLATGMGLTRQAAMNSITALREALAQPAHAPTYSELDRIASDLQSLCDRQALRLGALETQPEQWTPEDMAYRPGGLAQPEQPAKRPVTNRCPKCVGLSCLCDGSCIKQEPVGRFARFSDGLWREITEYSVGVMLYTSPPQRQPLTESKIKAIANIEGMNNRVTFARAIEAAHGIGDKT